MWQRTAAIATAIAVKLDECVIVRLGAVTATDQRNTQNESLDGSERMDKLATSFQIATEGP